MKKISAEDFFGVSPKKSDHSKTEDEIAAGNKNC